MSADETAGSESGEPRESEVREEAARRRRRAEIFGEVLPESTGDDRDSGSGAGRRRDDAADEWLRSNVPPHHG